MFRKEPLVTNLSELGVGQRSDVVDRVDDERAVADHTQGRGRHTQACNTIGVCDLCNFAERSVVLNHLVGKYAHAVDVRSDSTKTGLKI